MAMRRREFLRMGAAAVGVAAVVRPGWAATPISVSVKDHGAVGDGTAKDTQAIQAAIDEVAAKGGGEVLVQTGVFLTGGIALRSKVTLRLE